MVQIIDFQKIVEQYANQIAKEKNTRVGWISLDGSNPALRNYPTRKLLYTIGTPRFEWDNPMLEADLLFSQTTRNAGGDDLLTKIERTEKKKNTYSTSVTVGVKIGVDLTTKVSVKFFEETTSVKVEFNFSATHAWTEEIEKSWNVSQTVTQKAGYVTDIRWLLDTKTARGRYRVNIGISGAVAIWFRDAIEWFDGENKRQLWFPSPGKIVQELQPRPAGFEADGFRANFRATGTLNAEVGINSLLEVNATPLKPTEVGSSVGSAVQYVLNPAGKVLRKQPVGANK